ncbi:MULTISPECIES: hypothetical protein [Pantoea]|jgi:hypothetical protein|uniref:Uncharacterized protein n=1 Tax=Pantoea anthophila TaxID=470931 RepID=A0ABY2ZDW9_9GAMM|nr:MULTISPECIES: hypothetical protein [Pantoea]KAA5973492.1 hypothetical protein F3I51_08600 [Pantoea sp. M_6]KAA5980835.1 hypothetical protein F3I52_02795 [Pantoea sp. M_8]KAA5993417.1 hypothetical protein F3I50_18110 [Pantoea sp. M_5]KAA5994517.1 hypothetical protein F3I47_05870 [Pantoea sp. M_10]KAF6664509.1 hypothetical protein HFD92_11965 [Pantoea sp. EKM101V]
MKFVKSLISHAIEGTITFLAVIFAMGSFYWFENTWMKIVGCIGALIAGYVISYGAAKIRQT